MGCAAALRTHCLSSLACLTSVCSDLLHFWSLWRRRCSLAVSFSSRSRRNPSLALSVNFSLNFEFWRALARVQNRIHSFNLNIRYMVSCTGHLHTSCKCSHASVLLVQARSNCHQLAPAFYMASYAISSRLHFTLHNDYAYWWKLDCASKFAPIGSNI